MSKPFYSIQDIIEDAKSRFSTDDALKVEKDDFDKKISKALHKNVLILDKVYEENTAIDSKNKKSKKINQILNHQSKQSDKIDFSKVLLLDNEVAEHDKLVLNNEITDLSSTLILNNEIDENDNTKVNKISEDEVSSSLSSAIEELQSKNEDLQLKLDIISNQISNEVNEKIDEFSNNFNYLEKVSSKVRNDISSELQILQNNLADVIQKQTNLQNQVLDFEQKLFQESSSQSQNLSRMQAELNSKVTETQLQFSKDLELFYNKIHNLLEEEKRKKIEEDNIKKNEPHNQFNERMNSLSRIIEMQMTHSIVGNVFNSPAANLGLLKKTSLQSSGEDNRLNQLSEHHNQLQTNLFSEINEKIEALKMELNKVNENLDHIIAKPLVNPEHEQAIENLKKETQSIAVAIDKQNDFFASIAKTQNENFNDRLSQLIDSFKVSEFDKVGKLKTNITNISKFENIEEAKKFIEKLIKDESQAWIETNQEKIKEISKKLL